MPPSVALESLNRRAQAAMKEIVLVTLAIVTEIGKIDHKAPFMVDSRRGRGCAWPPDDLTQAQRGRRLG
jgi:hypothetical protein